MLCLAIVVVGVTTVVRMPVDLFPADPDSRGGGGYVLQWHAAAADRSRHHRHLRALLHAGQQHRPHRIAIAYRRQPDQGVLPAGNRSRCGGQRDRQSGHGRPATTAARNAAAGGAEVRCIQPAGVPGDLEGSGAERNPAARSGAVQRSQPDRERAGRIRAAAVRRKVPPDPVLHRSGEAGSGAAEPDGCGAHRQRRQHDSSCRRRSHRSARLQHLQQQPAAQHAAR